MLGHSDILASVESVSVATTYPANRPWLGDWASELTFIIDVQSATGIGTLTVKPQGVMPHTTSAQYLNERLFDLDATQRAALTLEGEDWPAPVCTQASVFPITVQRTYVGWGKDLKLVLTPTGSLVPVVSIVYQAKG